MPETDKRRLMRQSGRLLIAVGIVLFSVSVGGLAYNAHTSVVNTVPDNGIYYALMYLGIGFIIAGSYLVVFSRNPEEDVTIVFKPSAGPTTKQETISSGLAMQSIKMHFTPNDRLLEAILGNDVR
jgi:hypothetical protein